MAKKSYKSRYFVRLTSYMPIVNGVVYTDDDSDVWSKAEYAYALYKRGNLIYVGITDIKTDATLFTRA